MPYTNYHTARLHDPSGYDRIATKKDQGGPGIDFLIGFKGSSSDVISIHFRSKKFTPAKAKAWLKKHQFSPIEFTAAQKSQQEGISVPASTREALQRELSFDQLRSLVCDALKMEYPRLDSMGMPSYGCRFYVSQLWTDKALITSDSYDCEEDDPKFALIYFTVAPDLSEVTIDKMVPVQIVATPTEDGEAPVVIDESAIVNTEDIYETGKRNSKTDAKHLNMALRSMLNALSESDIEEETYKLLEKRGKKKMPISTEGAAKESHIEESSWDTLGGETINEHFTLDLREATIDKEHLIIKGTVILGPVSLNTRRYAENVQKEAIPLFEGTKAYLNHPPLGSSEPRMVQDLIGRHKNIRVKEGKTYSDIHLVNNETVQKYVLPIAESQPDLFGNSIVARVVMERAKDGYDDITKILAVRSVDLVAEPGTTQGLFESHNPAATQEDTMDWKDITLEQLKTQRGDIIEALLSTKKDEDEKNAIKAENERLVKENADLAKKAAEHEMKESARVRAELIHGLVHAMKAPESFKYDVKEGQKTIKPALLRVLNGCQEKTEMESAIGEWEALCKEVQPQTTTTTPIAQESAVDFGTNGKQPDLGRLWTGLAQ